MYHPLNFKPCVNCVLPNKPTPRKLGERSLAQIKTGFADGCSWCTVVCKAIEQFHPKLYYTESWSWRDSKISTATIGRHRSDDFYDDEDIEFYLPRGKTHCCTECLSRPLIELDTKISNETGWLRSAPHFPSATSSPESVKQMKEWLQDCVTHHKHCNRGRDKDYLPTRLIDLIDLTTVKLIETAHITPAGKQEYACSSHCWGNRKPDCITTKDSMANNLEAIPEPTIPKTFRQAMDVTRTLGIRYLWIDSLCIVQDSREDWENESTSMADIYSNASITIAATAAENCDSGLYSNLAKKYYTWKCPTTVVIPELFARRTLGHPNDMSTLSATDDAPLFRRGWALQERLLSRRILHFAANELLFECLKGDRCQCGVLQDLDDRNANFVGFKANTSSLFHGVDPTFSFDHVHSRRLENPYHQWRELVEHYSSLNLTMEDDVLPALSGAAKRTPMFQKREKYLAGHFESELPESLGWLLPNTPQRFRTSLTPTWSWISAPMGAGLKMKGLSREISIADVLDVGCIPIGKDPAGRVAFGRLRVASRLHKVTLVEDTSILEEKEAQRYSGQKFDLKTEAGTVAKIFYPDICFAANASGTILWCLELVGSSKFSEKDTERRTNCDLALVLRKEDATNVYERVGIVYCMRDTFPMLPPGIKGDKWTTVTIK